MNDSNEIIVPDKKLILLDHTRSGPMAEEFYEFASTRFVGQRRIVEGLAQTVEAMAQGFYPKRGPVQSLLLVGPSGAGKTLAAELFAWFLFGDPEGFSRVDGTDMSLKENVARLTGAPPGYIGYDDPPKITQRSLDEPAYRTFLRAALREASQEVREGYKKIQEEQDTILNYAAGLGTSKSSDKEREAAQKQLNALVAKVEELGLPVYDRKKYIYPSVFLLDEIEKGCTAFHNLLYPLIDEGKLAIASKDQNMGSTFIDFRKTIIIATSNLGEEELKKFFGELNGRSFGYSFVSQTYAPADVDQVIYRICRKAVDNFFPTPLVNRFGDIIAAHPHSDDELLAIMGIEINKIRQQLFDPMGFNFPIELRADEGVKRYLVNELKDHPERGIRRLQQKLKKQLITKGIVNLKATGQVVAGDILHVSMDMSSGKKFVFQKEDRSGEPRKIILLE